MDDHEPKERAAEVLSVGASAASTNALSLPSF